MVPRRGNVDSIPPSDSTFFTFGELYFWIVSLVYFLDPLFLGPVVRGCGGGGGSGGSSSGGDSGSGSCCHCSLVVIVFCGSGRSRS